MAGTKFSDYLGLKHYKKAKKQDSNRFEPPYRKKCQNGIFLHINMKDNEVNDF